MRFYAAGKRLFTGVVCKKNLTAGYLGKIVASVQDDICNQDSGSVIIRGKDANTNKSGKDY